MTFMAPPSASTSASTSTSASGSGQSAPVRRTVDAFTRTLHALLALSFAGAYITAESEMLRLVHVTLGYTLGGLLAARLVWGLFGPRHARWSALVSKLRGVGAWLAAWRATSLKSPGDWLPLLRQGQNLILPVSVAVLLLAIAPLVASGWVVYEEWMGDLVGELMEEVHEFMGNLMLMAVLVHVAGVVLLSVLRQRNLAMPMVTGCVPGKGPDLIRRNHRPLAVLLLWAVLAFWGWQWQTRPQADAAWTGAGTAQSLAVLWRAEGDHKDGQATESRDQRVST